MSGINAFTPGVTVSIAATNSSANVALLPNTGANYKAGTIRVVIPPSNRDAFIKFGDSSVAATANDLPITSPTTETFTVPSNATHVAAICPTGTVTIYFTLGQGI